MNEAPDAWVRRLPPFARDASLGEHIYFFHIPKTAGTSVQLFFAQLYGSKHVSPALVWDQVLAGPYRPEDFKVICGHFGGLLAFWLRAWPTTLSMLREPVARALSHINHVQREKTHRYHALAAGLSVSQYCAHPVLRRTVSNFQSQYLASLTLARALMLRDRPCNAPYGEYSVRFEDALYTTSSEPSLRDEALAAVDLLDAVGLCESHAASLELFGRVLKMKVPAGATRQRSNERVGGIAIDALPAEDLALLASINAVDSAVYARARERFTTACAEHGVRLEHTS